MDARYSPRGKALRLRVKRMKRPKCSVVFRIEGPALAARVARRIFHPVPAENGTLWNGLPLIAL
jgi:hypothetical protein